MQVCSYFHVQFISFIHRTTIDDDMSSEEMEVQYADKLLDFHVSHGTPASLFLTWGNLMKSLPLLTDTHLNGLDWDTIPGLFDHLEDDTY